MGKQIDREAIERLKKLDAASISDAMDRLGIIGGLLGIKPINSGKVICGQAFTVKYIPCGQEKGTVGDFIDDVEKGQVVVIDNAGRDYCTVWGDIMSLYASINGIEGTVIDGVCRDVPFIKEIGYPIFTKGSYMVTGKDRVEAQSVNETVAVSGVQVRPGDVIFGDDNGVLVIPLERVLDVIKVTEEIESKEKLIEEAVKSGKTLRQAREEMGYHTLQTKMK